MRDALSPTSVMVASLPLLNHGSKKAMTLLTSNLQPGSSLHGDRALRLNILCMHGPQSLESKIMKLRNKLQHLCERTIVWCLRRCLVDYSAVVTREIARLDQNAAKFQAEAIYVFQNHWAHLNAINTRLEAIERKGDQ